MTLKTTGLFQGLASYPNLLNMLSPQLNDDVSLNRLENVRQSAHKLGHSTESALLSIMNDVHLAFATGEATAVILLDQSAAFDTIDHDTLLDSLSCWFGVSGVVLDFFKFYLSDHIQCIKIGSILSDTKKLLYGVPQGSVLGPILFSLYYFAEESHTESSWY